MYANESYLIELLTQAGYLNEEILQYARSQKSPTQDLIDFLIQSNYLTEDVIAQVSASNSLLPVVDLGSMHIPQEVREIISPGTGPGASAPFRFPTTAFPLMWPLTIR